MKNNNQHLYSVKWLCNLFFKTNLNPLLLYFEGIFFFCDKQDWMTFIGKPIFHYLLSSHLQPSEQEQAGISGMLKM